MDDFDFKKNNFDLLRLLAALQVVFIHGCEASGLEHTPAARILVALPGVPVFFVLSGFLTSASWEKKPSVGSYLKNRFLRIYPALWACFLVSVITVFLFFRQDFHWREFGAWTIAQLTVGQFYNPEFLRGYGVGVLNGSLWAIPVLIQFYLLLPLLYHFFNKLRWKPVALAVTMGALIAINQFYVASRSDDEGLLVKLAGVTAAPHLYLFLVGILLQRNLRFVAGYLKDKAVLLLIIYTCASLATFALGLRYGNNSLNPVSALILGLLAISFGYSYTDRLRSMLRGVDLSYGIYIYHMVFINIICELSDLSPPANLVLAFPITIGAAYVSWILVERPSLRRKSYSIRRTARTNAATATRLMQ